MKVLHVNTLESGGAAMAAMRLHTAMLDAGIDSTILTMFHEKDRVKNHFSYAELVPQKTFFDKLMLLMPDKLIERFMDKKTWKQYDEIKQLGYARMEYISLNKTHFKIHKIKDFDTYDVIHLHWVADFLDWTSFFKHAKGKKIVWSLHDMAPFTGGYHYADGYAGYCATDADAPFLKGTNYQDIFSKQLESKKKIINAQSLDLHIVGLSEWMHRCAENSSLFKTHHNYSIPNTLDTTVFTVLNKEECKKAFNLPVDKKCILFISENLSNKRKGYDLFLEAYNKLKDRADICFVSIGAKYSEGSSEIIHLGQIHDQQLMARMYNAMDLVVIPSREDNLPNTVVEALCCGVPVLGFTIGGMPDLIFTEELGGLTPDFDSLSTLISDKLEYPYSADKIRSLALSKYSNKVVVDQYIQVYNS